MSKRLKFAKIFRKDLIIVYENVKKWISVIWSSWHFN